MHACMYASRKEHEAMAPECGREGARLYAPRGMNVNVNVNAMR